MSRPICTRCNQRNAHEVTLSLRGEPQATLYTCDQCMLDVESGLEEERTVFAELRSLGLCEYAANRAMIAKYVQDDRVFAARPGSRAWVGVIDWPCDAGAW